MTQAYYTYKEALDIVEDFMIKSGIREYCETICKGQCCNYKDEGGELQRCWKSKNACWKNEGRRLPCSIFICTWLLDYLPNRKELAKINEVIAHTLEDIMEKNPYYHPNTPEVQRKFRIEREIIDKIKSFNIKEYRRITNFLIEGKIKRIL